MLPDPGYLMHILNLKPFDYTVKTVGTTFILSGCEFKWNDFK